MNTKLLPPRIAAAALLAACSHGPRPLENDPAIVAAVHADLRLVGAETTWVARGDHYELVARTRADIVAVQTSLDRDIAAFRRVFPDDTPASLVVTIRRMPVDAFSLNALAAPVPSGTRGPIVEVILPTPKALAEQEKARGALPGVRPVTLPAVRAWLAGHVGEITGTPARPNEANGEFADPRIPEWAEEMIPSLASDSLINKLTKLVAARPDNLIPVADYFASQRGPRAGQPIGERGVDATRGAGGAGGTGGRGGGMGGGGGRGVRGGMGGRGGGGGARGSSARYQDDGDAGLRGAALFEAQSAVFARYLIARAGNEVIGDIMDGQILGRPIDEALRRRRMIPLKQMDLDWLQWLLDRDAALSR